MQNLFLLLFLFLFSCKNSESNATADGAPVLTPQEAVKDFEVEDGFVIESVASEPLVEDPVALTFDAKGNMWVVEMRGYMHDEEGTGEDLPLGRIKILSDNDDDGEYEKSDLFLDSLTMPRAITIVKNGILLIEPPSLYFIENNNGVAGKKILLDSAFAETGNVEHQPNGLLHSIDNWIYCAAGNKRVRFIDNEWKIEPTLRRGQWGISQDDAGRLFYNDNSTMLMADNFYPQEIENPERPYSSGKLSFVKLGSNRVFPRRETLGINRGYEPDKLDSAGKLVNVTSACGPFVYRGDNFPEEYRGNVFIMEPAAYLVKRMIIEEDGEGLLKGRFAYNDKEFLTSTDERFRPVNGYTAPDGTMYFIDMHRGIIQHTTYLTPYLRKYIDSMKLDRPINMGRIYRVRWNKNKLSAKKDLSKLSSAQLVESLRHTNGWVRDIAQQLLVERNDTSVAEQLRQIVMRNTDPLMRLHALFTLEGIGGINPGFLMEVAKDANNKRLFAAALYLFRSLPATNGNYQNLLSVYVPEKRVSRVQFLNAIGYYAKNKAADPTAAILNILYQFPNDSFVVEAVLHAIKGWEELYARYPATKTGVKDTLFNKRLAEVHKSELLAASSNIEYLTKKEKELYNDGRYNFNNFCAACHGPNGEGIPNTAPPLSLSKWAVNDDQTVPIKILLDGLNAPKYPGNMQGLRNDIRTNNGVIATVLTYVRNSWGNKASAITVEQVADVREQTKTRSQPYTESELGTDTNWVKPFNGKNFSGWHQVGGKANYKAENGMVVGYTVPNSPNSFMVTDKFYTDFVLELEVLIDTGINSGIQIRSNSIPEYKNGIFHGYQVEIDPSVRAWSGGIYDEERRGWLYNLDGKPEAQKAFNKNGWNKYRIEAIGPRIRTWINGIPVADLTDSLTSRGQIGLQVHAIANEKMIGKKIRWRNIRLFEIR